MIKPTAWRRRTVLTVLAWACVLAAATASFLEIHGDFRRWGDNDQIGGACDGMVDQDSVRAVLGDGDIAVSQEDDRDGYVGCRVETDVGGVDIRVMDPAGAQGALDSGLLGDRSGSVLAVPLGNGWSGEFTSAADFRQALGSGAFDEGEATVSLALRCAKGADAQDLIVSVDMDTESDTPAIDDPATRPRYATVATATAARASRHYQCGAKLGRPVTSLGLPVTEDEYRPLSDARGTCSGLHGSRGVTTGRETARGGAYETCVLGEADGTSRYLLDAEYGAFAYADIRDWHGTEIGPGPDTPARAPGRGEAGWITAKCPDGLALFTVEQYASSRERAPEDIAAETDALRTFAAGEAKAHGCETPSRL